MVLRKDELTARIPARASRLRHEETPLEDQGEPIFWHRDYQPNPHRQY